MPDDLAAALDGAWLVVEAVPERLDIKIPLWGEIDRAVAGYAADVKGRRFPAEVETYFSKKPASQ